MGTTTGTVTGTSISKPTGKPTGNPTGNPVEAAAGPPAGNVAVVWGPCSTGVEVRVLTSGARVASLGLATPVSATGGRGPGGGGPRRATTSVPVTVWEPPAWLEAVEAGDELVVIGSVRRRFFTTAAGGRGTKVEVEAWQVARSTPARRERLLARAVEALGPR
jgi:hypothetical protein